MKLKFEKEDSRWYVVLPNWEGLHEELEMVCGADTMLDILAQGEDSIWLNLSVEEVEKCSCQLIRLKTEVDSGSFYECLYSSGVSTMNIWLCNVTQFVFGEFPDKVWIY